MWPENWPAYELFHHCQTQWVYSGMGTVTGLNYAGVAAMIEALFPRTPPKDLLVDLHYIERGCLAAWREKES